MTTAKRIVYASAFDGEPKLNNFRVETEQLPALADGDVLLEAVYLSVDPYMRVQMPRLPVNITMIGEQIARVIESKDDSFPVGAYVWNYFGWRNFSVFNPTKEAEKSGGIKPYILEPIENIPWPSRLGVLGMTGNSAYFGFLEICKPKAGETVVVTGAAGAVGSIVGQIARIKGCNVIGIAGSDEKCEWLTADLKFHSAINYSEGNVRETLHQLAPNGVDCFFDNVGGELSSTIISQMNEFGRVSVCGSISCYNVAGSDSPKATVIQPAIVEKQLKIEGFMVTRWMDRWNEGITNLHEWIQNGHIVHRETIVEGFDNLPEAFIGLLRGNNFGKALVRA